MDLGVGMVGYAFMGRVHSQAWRTAPRMFDLPIQPRMAAICGRDAAAVGQAAERLGWAAAETDWRKLVTRDDVDLVDVCTPGSTHAEIAIAALQAGKHVLCEKPLANTVEQAEAMAAAAAQAATDGVRSMVAFNYRRVPALAFARDLIAGGRLGRVRHVRAAYLQDWIVDPDFPLVWRLQADTAGSGALGDLGAHIVDLAQFLVGEPLDSVTGMTTTFIAQRPLADGVSDGLHASGEAGGATGSVDVDDAALFLGRFPGGALASFEATRFATGRKNGLRIEVNAERGSLAFDLERLNELELHEAGEDATVQGFRRVLVTETDHPWMAAWWPPGHVLGYEHTFTHEVVDLLAAIADGVDPQPSFADGLQVQRVLDAVSRSAAEGTWQRVGG